eukprot:UC1_evm1s1713
MYTSATAIPMTYSVETGNSTDFVLRSAFWAHNIVANTAYSRYNVIAPDVVSAVVDAEKSYFTAVASTDAAALKVLNGGGGGGGGGIEKARDMLTRFSVATADNHTDEWVKLWQTLMIRYRDGLYVVAGGPPKANKDHAPPANAQEIGYDDAWHARIVNDTGKRYLLPTAATASMEAAEKRKLDLLARR